MSHHPNLGQNQNIRIANESFENVAKFKYLGMMLTNQNDIHDEIMCRLNSGNACYYLVHNLLSSRLISKNLKITVILPVVLYGCRTWSLTLREEYRLRVFENRILRRIFGPKRKEVGLWRKLHNGNFIACILHQILLGSLNQEDKLGGTCGTHGEGVFTGFWLGGLKVGEDWEDVGIGGRIILRWTLGR
jgi:hypothetical protein